MTPGEWSIERTRAAVLAALEDKEFVAEIKQRLREPE